MFDFFLFFSLFIVTCHMRSLDYKSTWTNCLYISMHSCFLIYILFTASKEGGKGSCFPFMCVVYISWTGNRVEPHRFAECSGHAHQIEYLLEWANVFIHSGYKKRSKKKPSFATQLHLWPVLLHCVTTIYFFPFVWGCLSGGGLERLIYDVNCAVKGKANRG